MRTSRKATSLLVFFGTQKGTQWFGPGAAGERTF